MATLEADRSDVIYRLHDRPPPLEAGVAALQHVLAVFVGIITPPLIIAGALGLALADASYVVSMSLMVSGVATFVQVRRLGPVGSGLLSLQGTSFSFLAPIIAAATAVLAAGIRIIASQAIDRRAMLILAVSLGLGLGVTFVPEAAARLPGALADILSSGIAAGGLAAIGLNLLLPRTRQGSGG